MSERKKGVLLRISAMLMFGLMGIIVRGTPNEPIAFLLSMQLVGAAVFFFLTWRRGTFYLPLKYLFHILVASALILVADFAMFSAVKLMPVANAVFIKFTYPLLMLLAAPIFLRESPQKAMAYAVIGGMGGLALVLFRGFAVFSFSAHEYAMGTTFALIAAVSLTLFLITLKHVLSHVQSETFLFYRFAVSALILLTLPPRFYAHTASPQNGGQTFLFIGFGILFAVLATLVDLGGIKRLSAQETGALGYAEPLASVLYGALFLSEIPTVQTVAGGLLIIVSGLLVFLRRDTTATREKTVALTK